MTTSIFALGVSRSEGADHLPQYRGESSRTSYSRNRYHQKCYRQKNVSFMRDHVAETHDGEIGENDGAVQG